MPTIWINAGEISGDVHGGLLAQAIRRLCPEAHLMGMAGPAMRAAGVEPLFATEDLSVMGMTEVLAQAGTIVTLLRRTRWALQKRRPDLMVVIDAPDYHFRLLAMAKRLGIPAVYYISPKLWAWRENRVHFLRKHVRRILSILPFETAFYARFGMQVDFVGHPLVDAVCTPEVMAIPPVPERIAVLPGSRRREITALLPSFATACHLLARRYPGLQFLLPVAPGISEAMVRELWGGGPSLRLVPAAERYPWIRSCQLALAASGTVTLETALLQVPTVVAYRFSSLTYAVGRRVVRVPFIALPNLVLGSEIFPELLQDAAHSAALAAHLAYWLDLAQRAEAVRATLRTLPDLLGGDGAVERAACIVLNEALGGEA